MKLKSLLLGAAASLTAALLAVPASAHPNGWYIGIAGGGSWVRDGDVTHSGVGFSHLEYPQEWDAGWIGAGNVGYRWPNWRLELELAYRHNEGNQVGFPLRPTELTEFSQMLNAYYDIPLSPKWTFSFGAGIGGDSMSYEAPTFHPSFEDDYVLAGQLIAQVSVAVSQRLELYVDYHYLMTSDPEFEISASPTEDYSFDVKKHALMIGLRYDLHADEEPLPPPPPAPPPPPPMAKQFIIFFGFNKCNITSEADAVLNEAASAAKSGGGASVRIVGHTDTSGSNAYNQKLSECRADATKSNLVNKGISEGSISTSGKGETELMFQTGDRVKEPQNRRATIDLN